LKKRKAILESGNSIASLTVGYKKNRQIFTDEQEVILMNYLIKCCQIYYYILICYGPFNQSRAGEEWVQCVTCKKWSHVKCVKGSTTFYVCLNCDSDHSD